MHDYQEDFINNLKYYRNKKGLSQEKLAELCDVGTSTIGCIESYKQYPSFDLLYKIANALSIHPADLFLRNSSVSKEKYINVIKNILEFDLPDMIEEKLNS